MADNSERKHTKAQVQRTEALKTQEVARIQTKEKIDSGAKYVRGPLRSMILKQKK